MSTKIQINSLAALERLIGGDTELEMEIRRSVVEAFAKKHLKAVARALPIEAEMRKLTDSAIVEARGVMNKVIEEHTGEPASRWANSTTQMALSQEARNRVRKIVRNQLEYEIRNEVQKIVLEQITEWKKEMAK